MSEMMERNKEMTDALARLNDSAKAAMASPWARHCDGITHLYWAQAAFDAAAFAALAAAAAKAEATHAIMERGDADLVNKLGVYMKEENEG